MTRDPVDERLAELPDRALDPRASARVRAAGRAALVETRRARWQRLTATVALPAFLMTCAAAYGVQATVQLRDVYVASAAR